MRKRTSANLTLPAYLVGCVACGCVLGATGWEQSEYTATITSHFGGTSQTRSGSTVLTLNHDFVVTIHASVPRAGDEVLASPTNDTLTTSYKLTGAALGSSADSDWVSSSAFISPGNLYTVEGTGPSEITFWVRGISATGRANSAGTYTASIILTATW